MAIHISTMQGGDITVTIPEPTAPNGKVLYKTEGDTDWQESDANITNGIFNGFNEKSSAVAVIIPSKDASGNDVTSIGYEAFYYCKILTSVTIGDGVTSIGISAFRDCSSLKIVTIPDSVTSIGTWAFNKCTSLTCVTIPNSVTSVGINAFNFCGNLTSVTFLGKTLEEVHNIGDGNGNKYYPWGISDPDNVITVA